MSVVYIYISYIKVSFIKFANSQSNELAQNNSFNREEIPNVRTVSDNHSSKRNFFFKYPKLDYS